MTLSTVQCKLSQERGYIVNFYSGIQGLKLIQVFSVTRVAKLVSVFVISIFVRHVAIGLQLIK